MSDDPTRPADDEDRRDERLAAALEVPPLDDVTRRRLVRRAVDESGGEASGRGRRARVLAVAAAVLAVLVIGGGTALVLRDDGDDTTVASRTEDARGASEAEDAVAPATAPVLLGDLGDVSDPTVLPDRVAAAEARVAAGEQPDLVLPSQEAPTDGLPDEDVLTVTGCRTRVGRPTLFGTATYEGRPALVIVSSREAGRTAFVLDAATCEALVEVPI